MRLQLTVQRHALPSTNILWTVRAQNPTSTSAHPSATISQLLEDVNDIIQLESDDWGLEDYVVEVGGYECLHFQPIDSVLKEDDKVTIRALQTSDLRVRKIGGRHQITADGRHIFDGVAFGRPYLRKTARPAFPIPPRKRRKLDLGHGQYIEDDSTIQELLAGSNNVADTAADVTEGEADPHLNYNRFWQLEASRLPEDTVHDSAGEGDEDEFDSDFSSFSEGEGDEADLELSEELKALLEDDPSESGDDGARENKPVSDAQQQHTTASDSMRQRKKRKRDSEDASEEESMDLKGGSNSPIIPVHTIPPNQLNSDPASINGSSSQAGDGVDFTEQWRSSQYDFNGFDEKSPSSDAGSSVVISSESGSEASASNPSSSVSESVSSSTESDSGSVSESGSASDSESDSESDSTSEEEDEATAVLIAEKQKRVRPAPKTESTLSTISVSVHSAPGEGSKLTHKNNERQKKKRRLNALKAAGLLAPNAGFKELHTFEQTGSEASVTHHLAQRGSLENTFEARKQELIEQLMPSEADITTGLNASGHVSVGASHALTNGSGVVSAQPLAALHEECPKAKPVKRAKLDVDSSRRMLFGSLGLRTPKTPADEQVLREKLAKQGRTPTNGRAKHTSPARDDVSETHVKPVSEHTAPEAWKDKIILSAVECEVEGQLLTTPPFPFVQRWQQGNQKNQLQGQLDQDDAYNPERQQYTSTAADEPEISGPFIDGDSILDGVKLNGAIQNQLIRDAEELSKRQEINSSIVPDLPSITEVNVLEALKVEDAVAGAVIAFKHLDMSKETNWQPELSPYRTAKIQEVLDDGTLKILLAERDRTPMQPSFDDHTGERIFDKFEMPIDEEEDHGPDNGVREVSYGDLIEPKLVEGKKLSPSAGQSTQTARSSTSGSTSDEEISQVQDSAKLTDPSVQEPSAQVEVSTPRQKEISKLIKDAGFHSSLDSELLRPAPESAGTARHGDDSSRASPHKPEKPSNSRSMNLDGAPNEADDTDLDSPLFRGSDSSSIHQDNEFHDSSANLKQKVQTSSIEESQMGRSSKLQNSVFYPKISPLVIHESRALAMDGKPQSNKVYSTSPLENGKLDHGSSMFDKDDDRMLEPEESHFDSLKPTIPPSEDAPLKLGPPSPAGSQFTNPCLSELEGHTSSDDDLPSLSEITSTARSGRVSPPQLKKVGIGKRKKSTSPILPSSLDERTSSTEDHTQTQTSTRFPSSQVPPGSQFVDLTLSSDPISAERSDGDYGSTQRSSVRIKQSNSQGEARESLSSGAKIGNRRPVKGRFGRPKA